jgi:hypothetical protein
LDIPGHPSRLQIAAWNACQHYHHCQQSLQREAIAGCPRWVARHIERAESWPQIREALGCLIDKQRIVPLIDKENSTHSVFDGLGIGSLD